MTMNKRRLGSTGLPVSEVSFGAWQIGNDDSWEGMDKGAAERLVHAALDAGINLFDTAPNYGGGESERILGEALADRRDDVVLVSKFGHRVDGPKDFSTGRFAEQLGWLTADGSQLACKAIAYTLSYDEVSCVIPGIRTLEHLRGNIAAAGCPITAEEKQRLETFWEEFTGGGKNPLCW